MLMNSELEQLLQLPNVWQASRLKRRTTVLSTGYTPLDKALHDGGWPDSATTELLLPHVGIGELRLLIPALRKVQQQRPWVAFISPPYLPFASAVRLLGLNPQGVLLITPRDEREQLWSAEQVLQSGCCSAVINWAVTTQLDSRQLRRLQQAAHRGQCWHTLVRHRSQAKQPSPSALRLSLQSEPQGLLQLNILKQRGGWSGQQVKLALTPDLTKLQTLSTFQLPLPLVQLQHNTAAVSDTSSSIKSNNVIPISTP
ncbi:translesion DNA synthesis-associated protein ImuA [Aurantivibrio plasticivorans]